LRNETAKGNEVLAKTTAKSNYRAHSTDAASGVEENMASSFRAENRNIVGHKTIENFEAPWN